MASLPSAFLLTVGIITLQFFQIIFWAGMLLLWWATYIYLRKNRPFAFWGSFLLVNLFWWPLLFQTIIRISFVMKNNGMDRVDGYGSPAAFLLGLTGEQMFFIPLSVALGTGIFAIWQSLKTRRTDAQSSS